MKAVLFILSFVVPILAHRYVERRAEQIRNLRLNRMGQTERNAGMMERRKQAGRVALVAFVVVLNYINFKVIPFFLDNSQDRSLLMYVWAVSVLVSLAISRGVKWASYFALDHMSTNRTLGGGSLVDSEEILKGNEGYLKPAESPAGDHGNARKVSGKDTDMADYAATVAAKQGGN